MRSPCLSSPRAGLARWNTWSVVSATATPPRCWRPRSSISASTACVRPRPLWRRRACQCGSIPRRNNAIEPLKGAFMSKFTLADLEKRVHERAKASATESYTRALLDKGVAHCAKKLGEEAIEAGLAAVQEDKGRLIAEAADLLYHLLVLLEARGISLAEVEAALEKRTAQTGHEEKASRPGSLK